MKSKWICVISVGMLLIWTAIASAQQQLVEIVEKGCKAEIKKHCADVTPGEGRILACLYAYGDKLSGKCEYALYDAAAQLEHAVAALSYVASECDDDLDKYCEGVVAGEGRLLKCIEKHGDKISKRCRDAIEDVGLKSK